MTTTVQLICAPDLWESHGKTIRTELENTSVQVQVLNSLIDVPCERLNTVVAVVDKKAETAILEVLQVASACSLIRFEIIFINNTQFHIFIDFPSNLGATSYEERQSYYSSLIEKFDLASKKDQQQDAKIRQQENHDAHQDKKLNCLEITLILTVIGLFLTGCGLVFTAFQILPDETRTAFWCFARIGECPLIIMSGINEGEEITGNSRIFFVYITDLSGVDKLEIGIGGNYQEEIATFSKFTCEIHTSALVFGGHTLEVNALFQEIEVHSASRSFSIPEQENRTPIVRPSAVECVPDTGVPTSTPTSIPSSTPTPTETHTLTPTHTATFTDIPTLIPSATHTDTPSFTPIPSPTPTPTPTPVTPSPTPPPTPSPTPTPTPTPVTPPPTPTSTPTPVTPSPTPTPTPTVCERADRNSDNRIDQTDVDIQRISPTDINGDSTISDSDEILLEALRGSCF
jgi:hypothetical protein